ncbi:MAG: hypothetical protein WC346_07780 [Methanogenium sp.]|jgi:hypothetical protein
MNFDRKLTWKIYNEAGTYVETVKDIISDLTIKKTINGGDSEFTFIVKRSIDDFDEGTSIKFNNRVKVYLQDSYNPAGDKLIAFGYIVSYKPYLRDHEEYVEVTCLSAVSKLTNDFFREGTSTSSTYKVVDLGRQLTDRRADQMMTDVIDHYRLIESNSMISNDYTNVQSTTDNQGNAITFTNNFYNAKHLDAIKEASRFLPKNKEGGYYFYWRVDTEGKLNVKNLSTNSDHNLIIGKHITEISGYKTIEDVVNRAYFWNEKGTSDPNYIKIAFDDSTSQDSYDVMSEYLTDSKVTTTTAAELLTYSRVYDKKDPKINVELTINGDYDLSSIEPGQTCKILNRKNNPFKIGSDENMLIYSVEYQVDSAILILTNSPEDFADIVEDERQRLDKELTWFGRITQDIRASQLSPSTRAWTTTLSFSASSDADAYRKVEWSAGVVYIPTGSSETAAKRVIAAGNTGNMTAGSIYYIYLDEEDLNPDSSSQESGTVTIKNGSEVLYDAAKSWTNDQWEGYIIVANGEKHIVKSNTATVLTLEDKWTIADGSYAYNIYKFALETTTDQTVASANSRIVFSNAQAAVDASVNYVTNSSAVYISSYGSDVSVNGFTQIAERSISADRIVANSITANEISASYIYAGTIDADQINVGTLTGFVVQTASTGFRAALDGTNNDLRWLFNDTLYGNIIVTGGAGNFWITLQTVDEDAGGTVGVQTGSVPGSFLFYNSAGLWVDTKITSSLKIVPDADNSYDLGASSYEWKDLYLDGVAYLDTISLSTTGGEGISTHLMPTSSGSKDIGSSSYYWNDLYNYNIYMNISGGTVNYNGLLYMDFYDQTTYGQIVFRRGTAGCDLLPYSDNYGQIGYRDGYGGKDANRRWAQIHGTSVVSGDLCFENDFRFTEEDDKGIALYNPDNEKIAIFMKNGDLYVKGQIFSGNDIVFSKNVKQPLFELSEDRTGEKLVKKKKVEKNIQ